MRVVAALGGNALLRRGDPLDVEHQRVNAAIAAEALAPIARAHQLIVTHGNGPQVGWLALQAAGDDHPQPLDVLGAESEGMIGYLLAQELHGLTEREIATLLTQTVVDRGDPAFASPTKPIGPVYSRERGEKLALERGWVLASDGDGVRRVVPSPEPQEIVELATVRRLAEAGTIVICVGGGGVPVVHEARRRLAGVEGVVDKDLASSLLATQVRADCLLLLTDVAGIERNWRTRDAELIGEITPTGLRKLQLASGSMGPKAEAAARYVRATGGRCAIGPLDAAAAMLAGTAGTQIVRDSGSALADAVSAAGVAT